MSRTGVLAVTGLGLLALALLGWWQQATHTPGPPAGDATGNLPALSASAVLDTTATPDASQAAGLNPAGSRPDSLQQTHDLREIYERFRDSPHVRQRLLAHRAWSACFPAFISPAGQAVSIDNITASLPHQDPVSASRAQAYRDIWARCSRFSDMPRDILLQETQRHSDAQLRGLTSLPGQRALQAHQAGDSSAALAFARQAVQGLDPYDIDSLQDFLRVYWWDQNERQPEQPVARPDLRAMAFSLAACQLGLDCSAASLSALQQCAFTGACSGSVTERQLQGLPEPADREALLAETARTLSALRSRNYKALGLQ